MMYFFKQKTAYEMRISDWSSDVCSSDLVPLHQRLVERDALQLPGAGGERVVRAVAVVVPARRSGQGGGLLAVAVEHRLTEIGRAPCRERVCQYVLISVVAVSFTKKIYIIFFFLDLIYDYYYFINI